MASTAVIFVLIITMGELCAGSELMTPGSAGGSAGELLPPGSGGGTASEFMPPAGSAGGSATTTAAVSALLRQELSLVDLGNNCSTECLLCLSENIGSCLADAFTCSDPLVIVHCFIGKFIIIGDCFGTGGGSAGREAQLTTTGSAGTTASEIVPGPGSARGGSASVTRTVHLSALLRNELAVPDVGINCSQDCDECLVASIGSCLVDAVLCFDPLELAVCLAGKFKIIVECFGT